MAPTNVLQQQQVGAAGGRKVVDEVAGWMRVLDDGSVDRTWTGPPEALPLMEPVAPYAVPRDGHALHDLPGEPNLRVYLPELSDDGGARPPLPVILHLHGGGFCITHQSWLLYHNFYARLAVAAPAVVVNVELPLAPERRMPAQIDAGVAALRRLRSIALSEEDAGDEYPAPAAAALALLRGAADFSRVFLVGDSSGGNLVHHVAARVGQDDAGAWAPLRVAGGVPIHPGFVRAARSRSELEAKADGVFFSLEMLDKFLAYGLPEGATKDHPFTCPMGPQAPPLESVPLPPMLVSVAEDDLIRDTNLEYCDALRAAGKDVEVLIENCKAVFDMMIAEGVKPNIVSYNALLCAYALQGAHKEALEAFKLLKQNRLRPDIVSYTSLLNAYGRSAQPDKARDVFNEMRKNGCKPNKVSYNALIDAYGSAGMLKEAISFLHEMERDGIQPDAVSISTLLTACGRCRQLTKIDTVLAAAKSRGIALNTVAYNSGIGSYLSLGDYEKALELYTLMRASNVKPDAVTYNILISGSCKLGRYAESLKFFEDMMDLKIHLTKEVYSSVICSYVKQGNVTEAESTFSSMKESGCFPDVLTYTSMIKAYSDDGRWRRAWDLFKEMESNDVQPDAIVCSSLMEALNKGSQHEMVLQLMKFMKQKQIPLNQKAYFEIIASCSMLREWKTASEIIEHLDSSLSSISVGTLNHLLNFLGKCGKTESMMKLFYKMVTSRSTVGLSTYTVLLRNLLVVGKWRKYIEVLHWMEDAGVHPTLYMYQSVLPYIWRDNSMDYVTLMQEKINALREKVT